MLYTPKYILVAELDKKVCECSECKKFRVLYNHSQMKAYGFKYKRNI